MLVVQNVMLYAQPRLMYMLALHQQGLSLFAVLKDTKAWRMNKGRFAPEDSKEKEKESKEDDNAAKGKEKNGAGKKKKKGKGKKAKKAALTPTGDVVVEIPPEKPKKLTKKQKKAEARPPLASAQPPRLCRLCLPDNMHSARRCPRCSLGQQAVSQHMSAPPRHRLPARRPPLPARDLLPLMWSVYVGACRSVHILAIRASTAAPHASMYRRHGRRRRRRRRVRL